MIEKILRALRIPDRPRSFLVRLAKDKRGGFLVLTAILMPVIAGFAGLGIDATMWMTHKRFTQSMVDEAAIGGSYVALANGGNTAVQAAVTREATRNGLNPGTGVGQDTIVINAPPLTGLFVGKPGYVEVTITRKAPLYFSSLLNIDSVNVVSRAVAGGVTVGAACIVALDNKADGAVTFWGNTNISTGCGIASNSSSSSAISFGGSSSVIAGPVQAFGDIAGASGHLTTSYALEPFSQKLVDPYASLTPPATPAGCSFTSSSINSGAALTPGRYCGSLVLKGNITMAPGVYIIDGGDLSSNGNTNITGTGVTIIMTASTPANIGSVKFTGNVTSVLSAPTSGPYAGVLFYQNPLANTAGTNSFLGNNSMNFTGAIYFPSQQVTFSGSGTVSSSCLAVFADTVSFTGNSNIGNTTTNCAAAGVTTTGRTQVQLVE